MWPRIVEFWNQPVDPVDPAASRHAKEILTSDFWPFLAAALIIFALCNDWVMAVPVQWRVFIAAWLSAGLWSTYNTFKARSKGLGIVFALTTVAIIFGPFLKLAPIANRVDRELAANEERCRIIQSDMLNARPRIADGPDKFQALGCRPQGTDARIFVPPTDRERAAGKALSNGGYPSPR